MEDTLMTIYRTVYRTILLSTLVTITIAAVMGLFTTTSHALTIDMVTVGNPGNAPDTEVMTCCGLSTGTTGYGSVSYRYRIGKFEVTAGQYTEFLNAVAKDDPNGLYNTSMGDPGGPLGANIQRAGSSPNYSYSIAADWANRPVNYVSFWDAARFANWLHNDQPTGPQGPGTTEDGAYLNVGNQATFARQACARFFVPTEDEWYKAAYHNHSAGLAASYFDYPTGTNSNPGNNINETTNPGKNANYRDDVSYAIGSPYYRTVVGEFELSGSPYGTFDQGGNVWEWNETAVASLSRGLRGGSFNALSDSLPASVRSALDPAHENLNIGLRVARLIPEPGSITLCVVAVTTLMLRRRTR
jgi:formylglycine-generating enzyme required for sulfatase activity